MSPGRSKNEITAAVLVFIFGPVGFLYYSLKKTVIIIILLAIIASIAVFAFDFDPDRVNFTLIQYLIISPILALYAFFDCRRRRPGND